MLAALALAVLVAACSAPVWVHAATSSPSVERIPLGVPGSDLAPGAGAGALVVAAAALALALARRGGRVVALLGMAAGGALVAASALAGTSSARASALAAALDAVGVAALTEEPRLSVWPWAVLGLGVAAVVLAAAGAVGTRRWGTTSRRFEVPDGPGAASGPAPAAGTRPDLERDADVWDALSRGDDPT